MRAGSTPAPTSRSSSSIFSSTDSEFASEFVPNTASPTFCDRSQRHWRTKRSGSGERSALKGVTTGDRTPVIRWVSFMRDDYRQSCVQGGRCAPCPHPTLKIDNARYVVTVDPQRRIIQDGGVLIENGRIRQVGKAAELAGARADRVIDARHLVVTPGFVNGHMHISYAHAVRGIFPDDVGSPLPTVFKLQMAMTEEEEHATSLLGIVELLKNGTVCFVDPGSTKFPDACLQAYEDAGIRVIMGDVRDRSAGAVPAAALRTAEAVEPHGGVSEEVARAAQRPAARVGHAVLAWRRAAPTCCRRSSALADEHGTSLTLHHGSGAKARQDYQDRLQSRQPDAVPRVARRARPQRRARPRARHRRRRDRRMARTGTTAAMCPVTAAKGARGVGEHGRLPELLARGVKVALGCDSPNNSNHLDIVRALNMAAIQYKDARQDMKQIPAETALELATLTGAQALGVGDEIGSLEPGKKADLVLFDTQRPEWQAMFNPINNLVYNADGRSIHTVIVDGRVVVDAYRQTFVDEPRLYAKVQEIGEKLLARTGVTLPRSRWPIV